MSRIKVLSARGFLQKAGRGQDVKSTRLQTAVPTLKTYHKCKYWGLYRNQNMMEM